MSSPLSISTALRVSSQMAQEQIRIVKSADRGIIPDHRAQLLRRIEIAQTEVGRLNKLLDEIRADVLHLTTE